MTNVPEVEYHPFEPFLPEGAVVLFLGSFPPQPKRWCMEFYYPNWLNDFWRVCGLVFYGDRDHFVVAGEKRFDLPRIRVFCTGKGIALFDTATAVRRLKDNASDKFLEVVEPTDITALLGRIPSCSAVVTTGQKATDVLTDRYGCEAPAVGESVAIRIGGKELRFFRMPSTSRAYPLSLEKKAAAYRRLFVALRLVD
ncbi:MAG: uracil-DNA glycosylase family protein [Bacteroidales bacterium]|nr:uracil-DNA glycosylase family protein [Bacteroidales bacterium]